MTTIKRHQNAIDTHENALLLHVLRSTPTKYQAVQLHTLAAKAHQTALAYCNVDPEGGVFSPEDSRYREKADEAAYLSQVAHEHDARTGAVVVGADEPGEDLSSGMTI